MNEPLYTTSSPTAAEFRTEGQSSSLKTTGSQVVHFTLGTARYMISPHAERGQAVKVTMQGPTVAVCVATVVFETADSIAKVEWETPFCAHPPAWQAELLQQVVDHANAEVRGPLR